MLLTFARTATDDVPGCPHCGGWIDDAAVPLGKLVAFWPLPKRLTFERDGYAYRDDDSLVIDCPHCSKPIVIGLDGGRFKFGACRTETDMAYASGRAA